MKDIASTTGITDMDLDWLKDFLALADNGNFSRAADTRNVTQPAFSRRIRALEEWIGVPLFVRSAQGATLTPAGNHLRPLAVQLVRTLDRARRDTRDIGARKLGSLSIAATHALSFTFIPGWIRKHVSPETFGGINLISDSMDACEQIMLSGEVHFLLCHHHDKAPSRLDRVQFASIRLDSDALVAVSAPDTQGQPMWPIPGSRSSANRVLGYGPVSGLGRIIAACQPGVPQLASTKSAFTSHLAATLLTMVRQGEGAAWLPLTLLRDDLAAGHLVRAGSHGLDINVDILLYRSPDCRNTAADSLWSRLSREKRI